VQALLSAGVKPEGRAALHWAAALNSVELVSALLDAGADPNGRANIQWERDCTPLRVAVRNDAFDAAALLIASGASLESEGRRCAVRPLADAARGRIEMLQFLLEAGADVDGGVVDCDWRYTPLAAALDTEAFDCARCLIEAGATFDTMPTGVRLCHHADAPPFLRLCWRLYDAVAHGRQCDRAGTIAMAELLIARGLNARGHAIYVGYLGRAERDYLQRVEGKTMVTLDEGAPIFAAIQSGVPQLVKAVIDANPGMRKLNLALLGKDEREPLRRGVRNAEIIAMVAAM
jgi:hypothetical protein